VSDDAFRPWLGRNSLDDVEPPLFAGEPEHCSLCGEPGHTHDDHHAHSKTQRLLDVEAERDGLQLKNRELASALHDLGARHEELELSYRQLALELDAARGSLDLCRKERGEALDKCREPAIDEGDAWLGEPHPESKF
jgi:hypothetical protein